MYLQKIPLRGFLHSILTREPNRVLFKGANVLCGDGVAGIITECFDDYAKVRAVIDDNSNISAKVMPANALCTVEGDLNLY